MPCEHLRVGELPLCAAVQGLMHPSLAETGAYCTSEDPACCALYRQYESRREKVPLETAAMLTANAP
jgi:hypothetical protein